MITETTKIAEDVSALLKTLGVDARSYTGGTLNVTSPVTSSAGEPVWMVAPSLSPALARPRT